MIAGCHQDNPSCPADRQKHSRQLILGIAAVRKSFICCFALAVRENYFKQRCGFLKYQLRCNVYSVKQAVPEQKKIEEWKRTKSTD